MRKVETNERIPSDLNRSGIMPIGYVVIVKMDKESERSRGGLFIPRSAVESKQYEVTKATLVEISPDAFKNPEWVNPPRVGERVLINKYAGKDLERNDQIWRPINDQEIKGVLTDE
jgi:co-chaperonin GroES (HSP10)